MLKKNNSNNEKEGILDTTIKVIGKGVASAVVAVIIALFDSKEIRRRIYKPLCWGLAFFIPITVFNALATIFRRDTSTDFKIKLIIIGAGLLACILIGFISYWFGKLLFSKLKE